MNFIKWIPISRPKVDRETIIKYLEKKGFDAPEVLADFKIIGIKNDQILEVSISELISDILKDLQK